MTSLIQSVWHSAKCWRTIPIGPISFIFRFSRTVRVKNYTYDWFKAMFINQRRLNQRVVANHQEQIYQQSAMVPLGDKLKNAIPEVVVIVGVGPRLGSGLARQFAKSGMRVAMVCRNVGKLDPLVTELNNYTDAQAYGCDATNEHSVKKVMSLINKNFGTPKLVVYCVQGFFPGDLLDTEVAAFEKAWRQNCLGAFIVGREAARLMIPSGGGTIVFTGSASGVIGKSGHLNLAVGKFGLRAVAQVMARELSDKGIHVVHMIIDGGIPKPESYFELLHALHKQAPSMWTHELDARPWNESFWKRC